jgi:hypothetical protein
LERGRTHPRPRNEFRVGACARIESEFGIRGREFDTIISMKEILDAVHENGVFRSLDRPDGIVRHVACCNRVTDVTVCRSRVPARFALIHGQR